MGNLLMVNDTLIILYIYHKLTQRRNFLQLSMIFQTGSYRQFISIVSQLLVNSL